MVSLMPKYNEPELPLDPPEEKEIGFCKCCGGEVYATGSYCYDEEGNLFHADNDCLNELWLGMSIEEKAEALKLSIQVVI